MYNLDDNKKMRNARIGFRATLKQEALIKKAAETTGKTVTQFILASACEAAENALCDQKIFFADEKTYNAFMDILERPAQIKPNLKKLMEKKSPWEK